MTIAKARSLTVFPVLKALTPELRAIAKPSAKTKFDSVSNPEDIFMNKQPRWTDNHHLPISYWDQGKMTQCEPEGFTDNGIAAMCQE
jgi:hypothetical protein